MSRAASFVFLGCLVTLFGADIPDVTLLDRHGTAMPLSMALNYRGPILLQFIFTSCPTICPAMSGTLAAVQKKLGSDLNRVRMISISIDPEHDSPARLDEYARKMKAREQWLFLTGALADIRVVETAFGAYRGDKMRHEAVTYLRPAPNLPWVRIEGLITSDELVAQCRRSLGR
jgi:protein SCO1/2